MIGRRLKEERKRLGLNQEQFALAAGITRRPYAEWEAGNTSPTAAQLAALARLGADVRYIVTGERDGPAPITLTSDERVLLDSYRALEPAMRKRILAFVLAGEPGGKVIVHGRVGQQADKIEGPITIDMRDMK